ncbi:hypothetical protein HD806DRAFT_442762 [Xylariaceae sp. AK1471]|nr:hypothetical protein HD806DRAFT_442762 [Xylariaceae sp. AK1471]
MMASADDDPPLYLHDSSVQQPPMPMQMPMLRPTMPMTPPEMDEDDKHLLNGSRDVARNLDILIHRLNRKPMLQDSLRWHHFLNEEEQQEQERQSLHHEEPIAIPTQTSMQPSASTLALDPIPELLMQCDHNPSIPSPPCDILLPPPPGQNQLDNEVSGPPPEDKTLPKTNDIKRPRRPTETRLHKSASNHRMLDLVTDMIENGVQCNVQNSSPPSPTRTSSTSSALPAPTHCIEPDDTPDSYLLPTRMELEIDMGFSEGDEETMLNDTLALRRASIPNGIRKIGCLRYRSSSEAAQACKNMKKCVPRMRRRRRTSPTSTPASASSASQPSIVT